MTMPTIILIAHFEILKGFLWVLLINTGIIIFAPFKTMRTKQNSASAHGIQKKLGITMHFSEIIIIIIIKLQFIKECHTLLCILQLFTNC